MPLPSPFIRQCPGGRREEGKREERPARSPASAWLSWIRRITLVVVLGAVLRSWVPPLKQPLRPLFGMPLTPASHCLAGYHRFVTVGYGISVCQECNLTAACPYCVAVIPAHIPFVHCAHHRHASLELQDTQVQQTAGTPRGKQL